MRRSRRFAPILAALALALALAAPAAAHDVEAVTSVYRFEPPAPGSYELPPLGTVDDATLLDPSGDAVPLLGLAPGELALVSFIYLSCGEACPLATVLMQRVDAWVHEDPTLRERVRLVTVSFDPARDTPEQMGALAERSKPAGRWRFLTAGDSATIAPVLASFGQDALVVPEGPDGPERLRHVLKIFLVDGERRIRNVYSTGLLDPRLVRADLLTLIDEPRGP